MAKLKREDSILVVIDVQEKITAVMQDPEELQRNIDRLVRGCHVLKVPAVLTEQYPKGLGTTTETVKSAFAETYGQKPPIQKTCFSGFRCAEFVDEIKEIGRKQVIVAGVESHVCIYQTVSDLLAGGFDVTVVVDAISSRTRANKEIALQRMAADGAKWSSTEMVLFELTNESGTEEFKKISALVK